MSRDAVLVVDATGAFCAVALGRPGGPPFLHIEAMARGQAEALAPMVEAALLETGLAPRDLGVVAAVTGPGSFAGARAGVAFVRGLALAAGVEARGVSGLDAVAFAADPRGERRLAVIHDARRGEAVYRLYGAGGPAGPPALLDLQALSARLKADAPEIRAGSGARLVEAEGRVVETPAPPLEAALTLAATGRTVAPAPFYARPPDAAPQAPR